MSESSHPSDSARHASTRREVSVGVDPTRTPAASSPWCLASAVPLEPEPIAPAWPIVLPPEGGEACDTADDGLGDVLGDVRRCCALLGVTSDLSDEHDEVGVRVVLEGGEAVDMACADDRVAADADRGREAYLARLVHELTGEGARFRYGTDAAGLGGDATGDVAGIGPAGADQTGAVGSDDAGAVPCLAADVRRANASAYVWTPGAGTRRARPTAHGRGCPL